ncbi:MAG: hypothetical protein ABR571_07235 [Jatrophihabitans sp.]|uniref:hypothetical protein n=1 Tax=Jatrophihabitans sp. TaxID=1932789 RepID=UPI003912AC3F
MVAVYSWDLYDARQVGFTTGWCPRLDRTPPPLFGTADIVADTLNAVIASLVARPESG